MTHHFFQLFNIRIIQQHSLTMISIKLVTGPTHGKCLLTRIPQNKYKKWFFQGSIQKTSSFSHIFQWHTSHPDYCSKNIGLYLDEKFSHNTHIKEKLCKLYKAIGLLRNLSSKLPRQALVRSLLVEMLFIVIYMHWK